jgi:cell shape-determining protein MreC
MAHRKITLRRMSKQTRIIARLIDDLESTTTKLKHQLNGIQELEHQNKSLQAQVDHWRQQAIRTIEPDEPIDTDLVDPPAAQNITQE